MSRTANKGFSAYQVTLTYLDGKGKEETFKDKWEPSEMLSILKSIDEMDKQDKKSNMNGWFMLLDELIEEKRYLIGRMQYAEYGYIGNLIHADSLVPRKNPKKLREGEEKYVYFLIRKKDGLLLMQGDIKLNRNQFEEYINDRGKEQIESHKLYSVQIETLYREDFLDEVSKLTKVSKVDVEVKTETTIADENEVITKIKGEAREIESTHFTLTFQAKYKRNGLQGYMPFIRKYKDKKNISGIKVTGKEGVVEREIKMETFSEKHPIKIELDANGRLDRDNAYLKIKEVASKRSLIR